MSLKSKALHELHSEQASIQRQIAEHQAVLPGVPEAARQAIKGLINSLMETNTLYAKELGRRHHDQASQTRRRIERNHKRLFDLIDEVNEHHASDADASEIMTLLNQLRSDGCTPGRNYEAVKNTVAMLQRVPTPPHLRTLRWAVFKGWVKLPDGMMVAA